MPADSTIEIKCIPSVISVVTMMKKALGCGLLYDLESSNNNQIAFNYYYGSPEHEPKKVIKIVYHCNCSQIFFKSMANDTLFGHIRKNREYQYFSLIRGEDPSGETMMPFRKCIENILEKLESGE